MKTRILLSVFSLQLSAFLLPLFAASGPSWWVTQNVISSNATADDFAVVNQGQLKHIATQAAAELNSHLPMGAGSDIMNMVVAWQTPVAKTDNYAVVNLGQLKTVAKPFYDRLMAIGYANAYPWNANQQGVDNYALANIGQVKYLFSFDVALDSDIDDLPDWWELKWFGTLNENANNSHMGDGLSNWLKYLLGLNPLKAATQDTANTTLQLNVHTPAAFDTIP